MILSQSSMFNPIGMPGRDTKGQFSQSTLGLPDAKPQATVTLKNGGNYTLTAGLVKKNINGNNIRMLVYNGSVPGPVIKVQQGTSITVNFKNNLDVATTLHAHGIRDENKFDGVPGVTQKEIPIGGTFTYNFKFPDAGAYWYHAHLREDYTQALGLFGNFLVVPNDAAYYSPVNKEVTLMVSDLLMGDGQVVPFYKENVNHTLMGRFGNIMLVNGETGYNQEVRKGDVIRFYLTNTANVRPFNLTIPGVKMKLVGSDNGKYEKEKMVDSVLLGPSERAIVEVYFAKAGKFDLVNATPQKTYKLVTLNVSGNNTNFSYIPQFEMLRSNTEISKDIDPLRQYFNTQPDKTLSLFMQMMGGQNTQNNNQGMSPGGHAMNMMGGANKIEWEDTMGMMNSMSNTKMVQWKLVDTATKQENMNINWKFKKGDIVKIRLFNDPKSAHPMQHPIHIHGQRFLVASTNGIPSIDLVFKDTVLVQTGDTVDLVMKMDNPGQWVMHCHIPEHMEAGMMSQFTII